MHIIVRVCVCFFVGDIARNWGKQNSVLCAVYESRDNKRATAMYNIFPSCPSFKKKPPRIPTGKMLAVVDSYIIQSSTALCMRKGNQSKK